MKGIKLLFGVCLGVLVLYGAHAMDMDDVARAATRGVVQNSSSTQSRSAPATTIKTTNASSRASTVARSRGANAVESRTTTKKNVAERAANVTQRTATNIVTRTNTTVTPRTTKATTTSTTRRNINSSQSSRTATTNATRTMHGKPRVATMLGVSRTSRGISRAATNESGALITNYSNCRQIYNECMDEFCANKDANLRRCACSARAGEFDNIQKRMSRVEDQMLDFNQRLLMVNMNAEDVAAVNSATVGEDAFYNTKDKTKSKRMLDDIAKKLNTTFDKDDSGTSLKPISLSLNIDSAFDTVDSFMGADTTSKTGVALYNAAIPVCRDIALEVCSEDELSLAVSGYQMLMEQDCNTVFKSYQSQVDSARAKVFESSALLDMSRLDAYQTRNSDDMLTCKRKMLEMLSDDTVCGENMSKCLDMTGKYIDPTTGVAFLTTSLPELATLIIRPTADQTWTSANSSSKFLTYLKNKKTYLVTATENCQDIADSVWDAFIEDALAQIKLAQINKLEEIRHACTALTTECLTSTATDISEFDARALSIFGVSADRTANALCADVRTACTALVDMDSETASWGTGVSNIATNKTYDTIISSCTQVGRNCIIQSCKSISSNFGLCDDIDFSSNRHAILERAACWPDVLECVGAAGDEALLAIAELLGLPTTGEHIYSFYGEMYGQNPGVIYDLCESKCEDSPGAECIKCRITERIWGNCEYPSNADAENNPIKIPTSPQSTLLAWFAINTDTAHIIDSAGNVSVDSRSCVNTRCSSGVYHSGPMGEECMPTGFDPADIIGGLYCPATYGIQMEVGPSTKNCCYTGPNIYGHVPLKGDGNNQSANPVACCKTGNVIEHNGQKICAPVGTNKILAKHNSQNKFLLCVNDDEVTGVSVNPNNDYPSGTNVICDGHIVLVDTDSQDYLTPITPSAVDKVYYNNDTNQTNPQTGASPSYYIYYQ